MMIDSLGFQHISDAFIAFCDQPADTSLSRLLGADIIEQIENAVDSSTCKFWKRGAAWSVGSLFICAGIYLASQPASNIECLASLQLGVTSNGIALRKSLQREEPNDTFLARGRSLEEIRNLLSLNEFRKRLASGQFEIAELRADGTMKPVGSAYRKAFMADHGRALIISREQRLWIKVRSRPIPLSELWVRLDGHTSAYRTTSNSLIHMTNIQLFDQRHHWLERHAQKSSGSAQSFRKCLSLIVAFRRPDLADKTLEQQKLVLQMEGYGLSMIEKIHSGSYDPFNRFIETLPMHEFP